MLKAAGARIIRAPRRVITRHSSSNRRSKHTHSPTAPRGIQQGDVVSGGKGVGLHEVLSPLHVDIEEVYLPVPAACRP